MVVFSFIFRIVFLYFQLMEFILWYQIIKAFVIVFIIFVSTTINRTVCNYDISSIVCCCLIMFMTGLFSWVYIPNRKILFGGVLNHRPILKTDFNKCQ